MNAAELDGLPIGAVVLDHNGIAFQRLSYTGKWAAAYSTTQWIGWRLATVEPFTLIYHPFDEAERPLSATDRTEP